jgi:hypothetical protein
MIFYRKEKFKILQKYNPIEILIIQELKSINQIEILIQ